jgi:hypothetical protein
MVHLPVSSHRTTAFPTFGSARRLATSTQQLQCGAYFEAAVIRLSSGPQICSPPMLLLPQCLSAPGRQGFYFPAYLGSLPPRAGDMLTVRYRATDGRGTSTLLDSQPCRLLPERKAKGGLGCPVSHPEHGESPNLKNCRTNASQSFKIGRYWFTYEES